VFFQGKVAEPVKWCPTSAERLENIVGVALARVDIAERISEYVKDAVGREEFMQLWNP
jgi:hypothetical protein